MSDLDWLHLALMPAVASLGLAAGFAAAAPRFAAANDVKGFGLGYRIAICILLWLMLMPLSVAERLQVALAAERSGPAGLDAPATRAGSTRVTAEESRHRTASNARLLVLALAAGLLVGLGTQLALALADGAALLLEPLVGLELSWTEGAESAGPLRQLYMLAAWSAFLLLGGHRAVLQALVDGQQVLGTVALGELSLRQVTQLLNGACGAALQLAGPLLAALLAARLVTAWLARLLPQFPGESLAGIVVSIFGLVLLMAGLPSILPAIEKFIRAAV